MGQLTEVICSPGLQIKPDRVIECCSLISLFQLLRKDRDRWAGVCEARDQIQLKAAVHLGWRHGLGLSIHSKRIIPRTIANAQTSSKRRSKGS